jgi:acylphosphatase
MDKSRMEGTRLVHHLHIHGRVQGVGFRWAMVAQAERLGVRGWVRNRRDGSVEAVVAGPAAAVQQLLDWAHRGPAAAAVRRVDVAPGVDEAFDGFAQRPTA